jgi:hypothetical protein
MRELRKWRFPAILLPVVCSLLTSLVPPASAQTASAVPAMEVIIASMARARLENRSHFRAYTVTRNYKIFGKDRQKPKSEVTADIMFTPPATKRYVIRSASGSGLGEKIVTRMLETELMVAKDFAATDISTDNYDFRFLGKKDAGGRPCYLLAILPKRNDRNLLRATIWVDTGTYLLQRVEGGLAKSPSWWVKDVHIVLLYGDAGGMWLQTQSESTANVRILGPSMVVSNSVTTAAVPVIAPVRLHSVSHN